MKYDKNAITKGLLMYGGDYPVMITGGTNDITKEHGRRPSAMASHRHHPTSSASSSTR